MQGTAGSIFLVVRAPTGEEREYPLGELALVIGRDDSADVRVDDRKVSRRHASFRVIDGQAWVEDLGSINGLRLNGKKIKQRAMVLATDVMQVGAYEIRVRVEAASGVGTADIVSVMPEATRGMRAAPPPTGGSTLLLVGQSKPATGRRYPLQAGTWIVGRLEDCAVPILDGSVSRQHARLELSAEGATVTDLGSSNGVFVNDVRVDEAELRDRDQLRFGNVDFRVELSSDVPGRAGSVEPSRMAPIEGTRHRGLWLVAAGFLVIIAALGVLAWARLRNPVEGPSLLARPSPTPTPTPAVSAAPKTPSPSPTVASVSPTSAAPAPTSAAPAPTSAAPAPTSAAPTPSASARPSPTPSATAMATPTPAASPAVKPSPALAVTKIRTATSPFSRRAADGSLADLPTVDPSFDFDAFVEARLADATRFETEGKFQDVRRIVSDLLVRDPINADARAIKKRIDLAEKAANILAEGDQLRGDGKLMKALELYAAVPEGTRERAVATEHADQLRPLAVKREMERVEIDLKRQKTWREAHDRLKSVLEVDPKNGDAKTALLDLEEKMQKNNIPFTPAGEEPSEATPAVSKTEEIAKKYEDRSLQKIALVYADGDLKGAEKRAEAASKKGRPEDKTAAKALLVSLKKLEAKYERTKNEVANDPAQAWSSLNEYRAIEREVLPESLKSYLAVELEHEIAEAFADRGASLFEQQRFEQAFSAWDAGAKLAPSNPKISRGLAKLESTAEGWAKEAELSQQRGKPDACERWRQITRMTRQKSEVHQKALDRLAHGC
ncbi:MAG: FHA domain-containing protein [Myxococcota bacterium]